MRGHMGCGFVPDVSYPGDHSPGQNGNASDWPYLAEPSSRFEYGIGSEIDLERNFFISIGWPLHVIAELEMQARNASVGLVHTAIASGCSRPRSFTRNCRTCSPSRMARRLTACIPAAPSQAWLLIERPVPLAAEDAPVVALNGQNFSIPRLIALSQQLGKKRQYLKLITRQELINSVTQSYGRVMVARAVAGLMKAHPEWSAKTGLAAWQVNLRWDRHWPGLGGLDRGTQDGGGVLRLASLAVLSACDRIAIRRRAELGLPQGRGGKAAAFERCRIAPLHRVCAAFQGG